LQIDDFQCSFISRITSFTYYKATNSPTNFLYLTNVTMTYATYVPLLVQRCHECYKSYIEHCYKPQRVHTIAVQYLDIALVAVLHKWRLRLLRHLTYQVARRYTAYSVYYIVLHVKGTTGSVRHSLIKYVV